MLLIKLINDLYSNGLEVEVNDIEESWKYLNRNILNVVLSLLTKI